LYVASITEHYACIQKLKFLKFLNRIKLSLRTNGRLRNFANWPAKFGKIYCGKLWALMMSSAELTLFCPDSLVSDTALLFSLYPSVATKFFSTHASGKH